MINDAYFGVQQSSSEQLGAEMLMDRSLPSSCHHAFQSEISGAPSYLTEEGLLYDRHQDEWQQGIFLGIYKPHMSHVERLLRDWAASRTAP